MRNFLALLTLVIALPLQAQQASPSAAIAAVLDAYHAAAAAGDWESYFDLMSDDGVFLGSDATERWTKTEFQSYASNSQGWIYTPRTRNINLTPDGATAWFDEILSSANYGTSRGSGVLIRTAAGWKISQYNLTFPIPNDLVQHMTDEIKAYEAQR